MPQDPPGSARSELDLGGGYTVVLRRDQPRVVDRAYPHGYGSPPEVAGGRLPGEARPIRHHGGYTSGGDRLPRAGESGPRWTATGAGATLRRRAARPRG